MAKTLADPKSLKAKLPADQELIKTDVDARDLQGPLPTRAKAWAQRKVDRAMKRGGKR